MGWLLRRKPKPRAARPRRGSEKSRPWDPRRTLLGLKYIGVVLLITALAAGWHFGEKHLTQYVREHRQAVFTVDAVLLADAPHWMGEAVQAEVQQLVADTMVADPLRPDGLALAVKALESNPWVGQVQRVQRFKQGVVVYARYREPVAVVQGRDGYHWVDSEGVRLPVTCTLEQVDPRLPLIVGATQQPGFEGEVWPGDEVQAGLALVRYLRHESYIDQVRCVDVGARDEQGRIHLVILTDRQQGVNWNQFNELHVHARDARRLIRGVLQTAKRTGAIWGLPPGAEQSIDPDVHTKLVRLQSVQQRYRGSIDARGKVVDVSGAAALVLQPVVDAAP